VHVRKAWWYSPPTEGVRCVCLPACLPVCLYAPAPLAPAGLHRLQAVRSVVAGFPSSRAGLATKRLLVAVSFFAAVVIEEGQFDAHNCVAHDMDHSCSTRAGGKENCANRGNQNQGRKRKREEQPEVRLLLVVAVS
jgi:hypothetical protein